MRTMNLIGNIMAAAGILTLVALNIAGYDTSIWPVTYITGPR